MIPREMWLKDTFGVMNADEDVIRHPREDYPSLIDSEKDKLRQTQVFKGEIVRHLGTITPFKLIEKYDGTKGWVLTCEETSEKLFNIPRVPMTAGDFLHSWKGCPYVFGGISRTGIDCSGFTQQFFLNVHNILLPKYSQDQRKFGRPSLGKTDNDVYFCRPKSKPEFFHVVIFFQGEFWHSRRKGGVVTQNEDEFQKDFILDEIRTFL